MTRYHFELATPEDDAELRDILAATGMDGPISVAFRREPSFFEAAVVEGPFHQTIVGRDRRDGRIGGFGSRSIRWRYVNGQPAPIGYLSSLRVLPAYRNLGLLARGYAFLRELHADNRTPLYLTTIAEGNEQALKILTSGRAGLPTYHEAGRFHTAVIPASGRARRKPPRGVKLRMAHAGDLPRLFEFLQRNGPRRQFFPVYQADDFQATTATFRGLTLPDLCLAFRHDRIVGVLGRWDQRGFRQTVVQSYRGPLRWLRPVYNVAAVMRHRPKLPRAGESFAFITGALPLVEDDDAEIFGAMIDYQTSRPAEDRPFWLIGLHERDALLPAIRARQVTSYITRLYYVSWEDGAKLRAALDDRSPYLELGSL